MAGPRRLISNFRSQRLRAPATPRNDPQRQAAEAAKRDRWRRQQRPSIGTATGPVAPGAQAPATPRDLLRLWRNRRSPLHPWWEHLPADQQHLQHRLALQLRRLRVWLGYKRQRIAIGLIVYLVLCSLPIAWGLPLLGLVAMLPLLLVPPVGWLIYRLVWHDFHH